MPHCAAHCPTCCLTPSFASAVVTVLVIGCATGPDRKDVTGAESEIDDIELEGVERFGRPKPKRLFLPDESGDDELVGAPENSEESGGADGSADAGD